MPSLVYAFVAAAMLLLPGHAFANQVQADFQTAAAEFHRQTGYRLTCPLSNLQESCRTAAQTFLAIASSPQIRGKAVVEIRIGRESGSLRDDGVLPLKYYNQSSSEMESLLANQPTLDAPISVYRRAMAAEILRIGQEIEALAPWAVSCEPQAGNWLELCLANMNRLRLLAGIPSLRDNEIKSIVIGGRITNVDDHGLLRLGLYMTGVETADFIAAQPGLQAPVTVQRRQLRADIASRIGAFKQRTGIDAECVAGMLLFECRDFLDKLLFLSADPSAFRSNGGLPLVLIRGGGTSSESVVSHAGWTAVVPASLSAGSLRERFAAGPPSTAAAPR